MSMVCETISVDRNGKEVIINLSDFDPANMVKWGEPLLKAIDIIPAAPAAPPVATVAAVLTAALTEAPAAAPVAKKN